MRLILEAHAETAAAAEEAAAKRAAKKAKRAAEASDDFADENTRGKGATARGSPGDIAGKASKKEARARCCHNTQQAPDAMRLRLPGTGDGAQAGR